MYEKIGYSPDGVKRVYGYWHTPFGAQAQCEMAARKYLKERPDIDYIIINDSKIKLIHPAL